MILGRYTRNPQWHQALDGFVSGGLYELTVDDGKRVQSLTAGLGPMAGGTVVMNIVLLQVIRARDELRCPTCKGHVTVSRSGDREVW